MGRASGGLHPPPPPMEMVALVSSVPRAVGETYNHHIARRVGLVCAVIADVDKFYAFCDPEKDNMCMYGTPSGSWDVLLLAEEAPPEMPQPALGINFELRQGGHEAP